MGPGDIISRPNATTTNVVQPLSSGFRGIVIQPFVSSARFFWSFLSLFVGLVILVSLAHFYSSSGLRG